MKRLRAWFHRLIGQFFKQRRDREFSAEMESHLQSNVEDRQKDYAKILRQRQTSPSQRRAA